MIGAARYLFWVAWPLRSDVRHRVTAATVGAGLPERPGEIKESNPGGRRRGLAQGYPAGLVEERVGLGFGGRASGTFICSSLVGKACGHRTWDLTKRQAETRCAEAWATPGRSSQGTAALSKGSRRPLTNRRGPERHGLSLLTPANLARLGITAFVSKWLTSSWQLRHVGSRRARRGSPGPTKTNLAGRGEKNRHGAFALAASAENCAQAHWQLARPRAVWRIAKRKFRLAEENVGGL